MQVCDTLAPQHQSGPQMLDTGSDQDFSPCLCYMQAGLLQKWTIVWGPLICPAAAATGTELCATRHQPSTQVCAYNASIIKSALAPSEVAHQFQNFGPCLQVAPWPGPALPRRPSPAVHTSGSLRSADQHILQPGKARLRTYGERAFEYAGPKLWNNLPLHIKTAKSVGEFKRMLKTHFFKSAFEHCT